MHAPRTSSSPHPQKQRRTPKAFSVIKLNFQNVPLYQKDLAFMPAQLPTLHRVAKFINASQESASAAVTPKKRHAGFALDAATATQRITGKSPESIFARKRSELTVVDW
jgi:hypothetical protein